MLKLYFPYRLSAAGIYAIDLSGLPVNSCGISIQASTTNYRNNYKLNAPLVHN